jgi:N-acetylmuramoyl-L-alanine amidase
LGKLPSFRILVCSITCWALCSLLRAQLPVGRVPLAHMLLDTNALQQIIALRQDAVDVLHPVNGKNTVLCSVPYTLLPEWVEMAQRYEPHVLYNALISCNWQQLNKPGPYLGKPSSLAGLKIVLDPGHFAHNLSMAMAEKKYLRVRDSLGKEYTMYEAALTEQVALILQDMLLREGATVMLTRQPGLSALGITADEWVKGNWKNALNESVQKGWIDPIDADKYNTYTDAKKIIRDVFRTYEMHKRVEKINAFAPHLVLSIHYNVEEKNVPDKAGFHTLHRRNYSMVFVPGAYATDELKHPLDRLAFLRQWLGGQVALSVRAAVVFQQFIVDSLGVPAVTVPVTNELSYLQKFSRLHNESIPGVYHRNLLILRLVRYPVILVEPLLQDNEQEFFQFIQNNARYVTLSGDTLNISRRVLQTARTYFHAIKAWVKE